MKFYFGKHSNIILAARLACTALSAAALLGTSVSSVPVPNSNERPPVIAGSEIPQRDGTDNPGGGQEISPQNDEEKLEKQKA